MTVYFAYFQTHISYGIITWGKSTNAIKVFKLWKRAIRLIAKSQLSLVWNWLGYLRKKTASLPERKSPQGLLRHTYLEHIQSSNMSIFLRSSSFRVCQLFPSGKLTVSFLKHYNHHSMTNVDNTSGGLKSYNCRPCKFPDAFYSFIQIQKNFMKNTTLTHVLWEPSPILQFPTMGQPLLKTLLGILDCKFSTISPITFKLSDLLQPFEDHQKLSKPLKPYCRLDILLPTRLTKEIVILMFPLLHPPPRPVFHK